VSLVLLRPFGGFDMLTASRLRATEDAFLLESRSRLIVWFDLPAYVYFGVAAFAISIAALLRSSSFGGHVSDSETWRRGPESDKPEKFG
jgi:hypothetical protein